MATKKAGKQIKVTLTKSFIGEKKNAKETAKALGLFKPNASNIVPADEANLGKVRAIAHLVRVEEV